MNEAYTREEEGASPVWNIHLSGLNDHGFKCVSLLNNEDELALVSGDITFLQKLKEYQNLHKASCKLADDLFALFVLMFSDLFLCLQVAANFV